MFALLLPFAFSRLGRPFVHQNLLCSTVVNVHDFVKCTNPSSPSRLDIYMIRAYYHASGSSTHSPLALKSLSFSRMSRYDFHLSITAASSIRLTPNS